MYAEIVACASAIFRCSAAAFSALRAARSELSAASACAVSADLRDFDASIACQSAMPAEMEAMSVEIISNAFMLSHFIWPLQVA